MEVVTEAFAMAEYLKSLGIAEERILKEEQSETTWENLKFSAGLIGSLEQKTAVVTNDFHLYRAGRSDGSSIMGIERDRSDIRSGLEAELSGERICSSSLDKSKVNVIMKQD